MSREQHYKRTYYYRKQRKGKQVRSIYIGDASSPLAQSMIKIEQLLATRKQAPTRR